MTLSENPNEALAKLITAWLKQGINQIEVSYDALERVDGNDMLKLEYDDGWESGEGKWVVKLVDAREEGWISPY